MRKLFRNRFTAIVCYLVAASFALSPVANAAVIAIDMNNHETAQLNYTCHHSSIDLESKIEGTNDSPPTLTPHESGCKHLSLCHMLGSFDSQESLFDSASLNLRKSTSRFESPSLNFKSSFLTRLDRPPRA